MPKKRILLDMRLDKIAAVDRPCQEHATMTIIKRAATEKEKDMPETITKKEHDDALALVIAKNKEDNDKLVAQLAKLQLEVSESAAIIKMTGEEIDFFKALSEQDKKDFIAANADDKKKKMAVTKSAEESVVVDGATILKSKVGDSMFAVIKSQQAEIAKNKEDIAKARDAAEIAIVEKRVVDEFPHVVGKPADVAKVLRVFKGQPKEVTDTFEAILKSNEELSKGAFKPMGHLNGREEIRKGQAPFEEKIQGIMKRDSVPRVKAMEKAAIEFPDELAAYQAAGREQAA